jgi:hypothetical protein
MLPLSHFFFRTPNFTIFIMKSGFPFPPAGSRQPSPRGLKITSSRLNLRYVLSESLPFTRESPCTRKYTLDTSPSLLVREAHPNQPRPPSTPGFGQPPPKAINMILLPAMGKLQLMPSRTPSVAFALVSKVAGSHDILHDHHHLHQGHITSGGQFWIDSTRIRC